jgi:hypothetical protein
MTLAKQASIIHPAMRLLYLRTFERLGGAGLQPLNETDDIVPYLYPNRILCH